MESISSGVLRLRRVLGRSRKHPTIESVREESIARYGPGGYHPIRLGDHFNDRNYKIARKLGYGIHSTVWLAYDQRGEQYVALKVLTADTNGHDDDTFELDILKHMRSNLVNHPGVKHVVHLVHDFKHQGPNGEHVGLVFNAMGPNMFNYRRFVPTKPRVPMHLVMKISRQLLLALTYVHDVCQVIHTDIKLQDILIETSAMSERFQSAPPDALASRDKPVLEPNDFYMSSTSVRPKWEDIFTTAAISVRLADFGKACWFNKHMSESIQQDVYRAPEVILGARWNHKVDIWNLGLILWELAEGRLLLDGKSSPTAPYTAEAHLAQMTECLGDFPNSLLDRSLMGDLYFDAEGQLLRPSSSPPDPTRQYFRNLNRTIPANRHFVEFIGSMLRLDPQIRPDARELLRSPWLAEVS